jgi:hypothetical protein
MLEKILTFLESWWGRLLTAIVAFLLGLLVIGPWLID